MLLELTLNEMDVDFGLAARRDTVQQGHVLLHEGKKNLVVSLLLSCIQLLDEFGMGLTTVVQAAHFQLVGLQKTALHQQVERGKGCPGVVHELLTGDLHDCGRQLGPFISLKIEHIPSRQLEIGQKSLLLLGGSTQHVEGHMECGLVTIGRGEANVGLGARLIAILGFQSGWQGCLIDLTHRRHVVVGNPRPQAELILQQDGSIVQHLRNVLHHIALRLLVVQSRH